MPTTTPTLGRAALRNRIFEKRIRQREVARRIGMREARLSDVINGYTDPTLDEQRALASLLDTSVKTLFGSRQDDGEKRDKASRRR